MRDFLPVLELLAKAARDGYRSGCDAARSGLSVVGALVDCGIPRQHAGEQWLTEKEAEEEVAEPAVPGWLTCVDCGGDITTCDCPDEDDDDTYADCDYTPRPRTASKCGKCNQDMILQHYCEPPVAMAGPMDDYSNVAREDEAWSSGWKRGWASATEAYAVFQDRNTPKDSRTNAGATSSRAVEEGLTEETPPVSSVSAADLQDICLAYLAAHEYRKYAGSLYGQCSCGVEFGSVGQWREHVTELQASAMAAAIQEARNAEAL